MEGDKGPVRREPQAYWFAISFGTLLMTPETEGLVIAATGGNFSGSFDAEFDMAVPVAVESSLAVDVAIRAEFDVGAVVVVLESLDLWTLGDVLEALEKLCSKGLGSWSSLALGLSGKTAIGGLFETCAYPCGSEEDCCGLGPKQRKVTR